MMKTKMVLPFALGSLLIAGCGEQSGATGGTPTPTPTPPPTVAEIVRQMEQERILPALDRSVSLIGTDANRNGVRDDIDTYIFSLALPATTRPPVEQYAKTFTQIMEIDLNNNIAINSLVRDISRASSCMQQRFTADRGLQSRIAESIEAYSLNTRERNAKNEQFLAKIDGSVFSVVDEGACDA